MDMDAELRRLIKYEQLPDAEADRVEALRDKLHEYMADHGVNLDMIT